MQAASGACAVPKRSNDPSNLTHLPEKVAAYCIDPTGSDRGFGDGAKNPLEGICDIFDGACEIYRGQGVKRVVEARYVDGGGTSATIDVHLSTFGTPEQAYAMFTLRVVGDGDPAHPDSPRPLEAPGVAALGIGNAYLWRGAYLAEITYNDTDAITAAQVKAKGDELLPTLVKELAAKLPGEATPPAAVAALPSDKRLPLGVRWFTSDVLGIAGAGPGAFGYLADGAVRWRVLAMVRPDADQAKDALGAFARVKGAADEKGIGEDARRILLASPGGPQIEWIVARKGSHLFGIGDESTVLQEGMSAEERRARTLTIEQKREKLAALLQ
jgi:uncharacterized protein DUF6599